MSLFLVTYLAIYGGMHLYLISRTVKAFQLAASYPVAFFLFSLLMVSSPVLVHLLERSELEVLARVTAWLGYLWMGFFFLYLSATIILDLVRAVACAGAWLTHRSLDFPDARLLSLSLLIAAAATLYGLFEARHLTVEEVRLESPKIPKQVGRVRVVQISDVHLGLMVGKGGLNRILERVAALKPDLLVSTGDLLDGQIDGLRGVESQLRTVRAPLGNFAVLGNHEIYAGVTASAAFTERGGFRLLRGESVAVTPFLTLAGVDDPASGRDHRAAGGDRRLLEPLPRDRFILLLKHRPSLEGASLGLFDLQLSGHVHKGQIFPFNLLTRLAYPAPVGLSEKAGSSLYVSRGSGTWGPPLRVLAPPEITVIDLIHPGTR